MENWNSYLTEPRKFSPADFAVPDPFYGPVYSWVWNAPVDEQIIHKQIDEMTQAGIRVFYIIPEPPEFRPETMITTMSPAYLSPEFFRLVRLAVEYGREKGMTVWIYDEGGWPSGNACGQLVLRRPDLAGKNIVCRDVELKAGETYVPGEYTVAAFRNRTRVAAGTVFPEETVLQEYYRNVRKFGVMSPKAPVLPDLLEPDTIPLFIEMTHEKYYEALGDLVDAVVPCVFIDEPHTIMPAFPWDFQDRFREEYGYDIEDYLYVLLEKENLSSREAQARQDYASLIGKLHVERLMMPILTWCREHNMIFTGHLNADHDLRQFQQYYGDPLPLLRRLDLPGIDVIWRQIYPCDKPVYEGESFFPRIAASVASQNGKLLTLSETFGVYGQNVPPETMRWVSNYQIVRGIQIINPMIVPCGRDEWLSYGERPYFCTEMPGHTHMTQWNLHMNRISYFMSCGLPTTDCALYLPSERLWVDKQDVEAAIQAYHDLGEALEAQGITFDLIDREGILMGQLRDGALEVGLASYRKIFVPEGMTPPEEIAAVIEQLDGQITRWAVADNPALKTRVRREEDGTLAVMVFCESTEPARGTVTLNTCLPCWQADPADGKMKPLAPAVSGQQKLEIALEAGQELLILATDRPVDAQCPGTLAETREATLLSCRTIKELELIQAGFRRKDEVRELTPAPDFASMVGQDFSGEIAYEFTLELSGEDLGKKPVLVLDKIEHSARVLVNGNFAGYVSLKPYRLELDPAWLQAGQNRLVLEVANTASNAYAVVDPYQWFDSAHVGPYNDREQVMERERRDGGLYGTVKVEFYQ